MADRSRRAGCRASELRGIFTFLFAKKDRDNYWRFAVSAKRFKSDAFEAIHSAASGLRKANGIDTKTMREYEHLPAHSPF